ncbi:MAG: T9SS type A sorting domain-containing protein [Bacteroidetes bacterium]|nr:T9SS type A sorting domain-containing protein [Bacteroidota bacterium]
MKKYYILFAMSFLLFIFQTQAQTTFEKWIGGSYDSDVGFKIIPALDGGYIITGSWTMDYGASWDTETDAALIKIDESGNIVWRTMIPTVTRYTDDKLLGITTTQEGGYITTGIIQTENAVGKEDLLIAKFTSGGDTLWTKRYDFAAYDCGNAIVSSGDGGYIIAGKCGSSSNDNVLLLKINGSGDTLWTQTWGGAYEDRLNDVVSTGDGNFFAVGCTKKPSYPYNLWDYIVKFSASGDTLWTKRLEGGEAMSIRSTSDGGYIIAEKQAIVKVSADGDEEWRKAITTFLGIYGGEARCAIPITGGGYIATGKSDVPTPANQQLFIIQITAAGDTVWTKRFGKDESNKADEGYSVVETADNGYLAVGFTSLNESAGSTNFKDIFLVKVSSDGTTDVENRANVKPKIYLLLQNYPNPFNPSTLISYQLPATSYVSLKVFDQLGREVATLVNEQKSAGSYTVKWNANGFTSGVYFCRFQAGNSIKTRRLILLK